MDRLTRKSDSGMVWFIDREHESGHSEREPCEMDAHHARLAIAKLAEYEDLEEQGKLLKLPCAVGDTVYRIVPKIYRKIAELKIKEFVVCENGLCFRTNKTNFNYSCAEFGEYIFLTKEAAEAALKEMSE